jgi:hypothetical protein
VLYRMLRNRIWVPDIDELIFGSNETVIVSER